MPAKTRKKSKSLGQTKAQTRQPVKKTIVLLQIPPGRTLWKAKNGLRRCVIRADANTVTWTHFGESKRQYISPLARWCAWAKNAKRVPAMFKKAVHS